jgi:hypothetical protein
VACFASYRLNSTTMFWDLLDFRAVRTSTTTSPFLVEISRRRIHSEDDCFCWLRKRLFLAASCLGAESFCFGKWMNVGVINVGTTTGILQFKYRNAYGTVDLPNVPNATPSLLLSSQFRKVMKSVLIPVIIMTKMTDD